MELGNFFSSGTVTEQVVLDCYRLAKYYGRNPDEFLAKPLSAIQRHIYWTGKLIEAQVKQREDEAEQ